MSFSENEAIFDDLERDLPDLDIASLEYFATFPFDPRLEQLLDNEPPTVEISMSGHSDELPDNPLFPSNEENPTDIAISDDEVITIDTGRYRYNLNGSSTYDGRRLDVDLTINDGDSNCVGVKIEDVPNSNDAFIAYRIDIDKPAISEVLDTKGLIRYLCLLANVEARVVDTTLNSLSRNSKHEKESIKLERRLYQDYFMSIWNRLGKKIPGSTHTETRKIFHELPVTDPKYKEVIRFQQKESEDSEAGTLATTLEYAKIDTELDIEDTYSLNLVFSAQNRDTLDQDASRIIASVAEPMRLKKASAKQVVNGKQIPLDVTDEEVQQKFVDWFDQLVSA